MSELSRPVSANVHSLLLVIGADPQRLDAAMASDAHLVCIDMEDTVADKDEAFGLAAKHLDGSERLGVRINPVRTAEGLKDIYRLSEESLRPGFVCIPKVEVAGDLEVYASVVPDIPIYVVLETPGAIERAFEIAAVDAPLAGLILGGKDLSETMGSGRTWDGLLYARQRVSHAAASRGCAAIDEPYRPLEDLIGLETTCARLRELGMTGKTMIVPEHAGIVNNVFRGRKAHDSD